MSSVQNPRDGSCVRKGAAPRATFLSEIEQIDEQIFVVAAQALADSVSDERPGQDALFPDASELREVSARIATAVSSVMRAPDGWGGGGFDLVPEYVPVRSIR